MSWIPNGVLFQSWYYPNSITPSYYYAADENNLPKPVGTATHGQCRCRQICVHVTTSAMSMFKRGGNMYLRSNLPREHVQACSQAADSQIALLTGQTCSHRLDSYNMADWAVLKFEYCVHTHHPLCDTQLLFNRQRS